VRYTQGSLLSKAVFFEAYNRHRELPLREVFELEWEMAIAFTKRPDFHEGVRALLIDKDQKPNWQVSQIETALNMVGDHFKSGETNRLREKFAKALH
jgi:Enoyl-CoA hydratase/isomerase